MASVLTLQTVRTRRAVTIDGKSYELRDRDEIGIAGRAVLVEAAAALGKLSNNGNDLTRDEADIIVKALRLAVNISFVEIPEGVAAKLTDDQCIAVVNAFSQAPEPPATEAKEEEVRKGDDSSG